MGLRPMVSVLLFFFFVCLKMTHLKNLCDELRNQNESMKSELNEVHPFEIINSLKNKINYFYRQE